MTIYRQLAERDPAKYLPDVASELANLGQIDTTEKRFAEARAHYEEALSVLSNLPEVDGPYVNELTDIEASLRELGRKGPLTPAAQMK